jgi:hypothetical protein
MQSNFKMLNHNIYIDESKLIGKGSTGNVYLGLAINPQKHNIAIKAIDLQEINNEVTKYLLSC